MKKNLFFILILLIFSLAVNGHDVRAQDKAIIYFFGQEACPHCAKEKIFLEKMVRQNSALEWRYFDLEEDQANVDLLLAIGEKLGVEISGVPFTLVGEKYFIGWYDEQTTGGEIEQAVNLALATNQRDIVKEITGDGLPSGLVREGVSGEEGKIDLPILGAREVKNISLPLLTVVMGVLDGFNPCAMWALLFLISLLLGMENRKRMWALGVTFIVASAAVYFLFMAAWLNLILFFGFLAGIRLAVGLLALAGGGYNIKQFWMDKNGGCRVAGGEKRRNIFAKIRAIIEQNSFWLALGGIIVLALAVNLVELICSAGLPAIYTQILALNRLVGWHYYLYIIGYIFFFMLDDLFVFFVAMVTLKMTGITTKYSRYTRFASGLLMIVIGCLLIFKPQWLMFN